MSRVEARHLALPFGFMCPEIASVGKTKLGPLIAAIIEGDQVTLAAMQEEFAGEADAFDRFVAGVGRLAAGEYAAASSEFARTESGTWRVSASVLHAIALAASGQLREAIALANQISDVIRVSGTARALSYAGDRALRREGVRCLQVAEAAFPEGLEPLEIAAPFRYVVGYPRSGNTLLMQFLTFAFAAPNYSVYATGEGWYFSRRFHERAPGHAVFVKDHVLHSDYLEHEILSPVRDGRIAMVSLARFLYAEGGNPFVRRGELADFLSYVAARLPFGFWGDHTRKLLEARDRGARVQLVRYEEMFGDYQRLLALARELAGGNPVPCVDEESYIAFGARSKIRLAQKSQWSEGLALPEDSFIPHNWSVGGETIDWRRAFDAPARCRFHDLGGTEMLIRLGYETDESWWRQG
jgi:hypothetical protein